MFWPENVKKFQIWTENTSYTATTAATIFIYALPRLNISLLKLPDLIITTSFSRHLPPNTTAAESEFENLKRKKRKAILKLKLL